jgi:hypothetical protein
MTGEWTTIDKSAWGHGPWEAEPDKIHWIDPETDLDCLMVRHTSGGHWCGYVAVTEGHPAFELDYDRVHELAPRDEEGWSSLRVHGGLTFADACRETGDPATGVCHVPEPGRPGHVWWFGFDCAHLNDLSPGHVALGLRQRLTDVYRDRAYVEAEVRSLAAQLKALEVARV